MEADIDNGLEPDLEPPGQQHVDPDNLEIQDHQDDDVGVRKASEFLI